MFKTITPVRFVWNGSGYLVNTNNVTINQWTNTIVYFKRLIDHEKIIYTSIVVGLVDVMRCKREL